MDVISEFQREYRFLSNFWYASVEFEGMIFPTVENAYQASKTLNKEERIPFITYSPGQAKYFGKCLQLRPDWELVKINIMFQLVLYKFTRHENMKQQLLATGSAELIESNYWKDCFYGVYNGRGKNYLGKILMQVREMIRNNQYIFGGDIWVGL